MPATRTVDPRHRASGSHGGPRGAARGLRVTVLLLTGLWFVLGGLLAGGEALADPGGVHGAVLVGAWLVPAAAGAVLAWRRPDVAVPVLAVAVAAVVAASVWAALPDSAFRALEQDQGPVRTVATFAVTCVLGVLAWHRPAAGAVLLVVLALAPALVAGAPAGGSSAVVAVPALLLAGLAGAAAAAGRDTGGA